MLEYVPSNSIVHRLDPRSKIYYAACMLVASLVVSSIPVLLCLLLVTIAVWMVARIPLSKCRLLFFVVGSVALVTIGTQSVFYTESMWYLGSKTVLFYLLPWDVPIIGRLPVTWEGIEYGVMLTLRLLVIVLPSLMVPFTTHPSEIMLVLRKFRLPNWLILLLTMSIRFVPMIFQNLGIIRNAQKLRGGRSRFKDLNLMLGTLLIISLKTAKQMALALDSKAFGQSKQRTSLKTINFAQRDVLFCSFSSTVLAAVAVWTQIGAGWII